jgi:hypothetical protein
MDQPVNCEECRVISCELADAYVAVLDAVRDSHGSDGWLRLVRGWADPRFRETLIESFYARLADDGEPGRQTLPVVAPEIRDLSKWHSAHATHLAGPTPIARAFHRKFMHECRTGHKIKLLART